MAVSYKQVQKGRDASGSVTVNLTGVTAGSTLVALAYSFNDTNYVVDDGGTPMTKDVDYYQPGGTGYVTSVWSIGSIAAGSHAVHLTGGSTNSMLWVYEIAADASLAFDVSAVADAGDYGITVGATPTTTGAHAIALSFAHGAGIVFGHPSGWTDGGDLIDGTYSRNGSAAHLVLTTTQAVTAAWTTDISQTKSGVVAVYKESGGGGGGGTPFLPPVIFL